MNDNDKPDNKKEVYIGLGVLAVFLFGFMLWITLAPVDTASICSGQFAVEGNRKTIQHLEGGIIAKIHVSEGDKVSKGQAIISLDDTVQKTSLMLIKNQLWEAISNDARLDAELLGKDKIIFPESLLNQAKENPNIEKIIYNQNMLFKANNDTYSGRIETLEKRIEQYQSQIKSHEAQVIANSKQLALIEEEIVAVDYLAKKQLVERPRLLALKREASRLLGNRDELLGLIAKTRQSIGETKTQMLTTKDERRKTLLEEQRKNQILINELKEKQNVLENTLKRVIIESPIEGYILNLKKHTIAGVISPGQEVCDIVPSEKNLILEVRVPPKDINMVMVGLPAKIHLSAYKQRTAPVLYGVVSQLSADMLEDPLTHERYYKAIIDLSEESRKKLDNIRIYPGMPAQAFIITQKRTLFQYLIDPLMDNFRQAFREE